MRRRRPGIAVALAVALAATQASAQEPATLEVCAVDAASGIGIPSSTVIFVTSSGGAAARTTATDGCVVVPGMQAGDYKVTVLAAGTLPVDFPLHWPSEPSRRVVKLKVASASVETDMTIEARRERPEETRRTITPEEARTLPGTNGDAIKVIQDLPGMARSAFGSGALLVRGAAPGDTKVFLDAQEIPQLYHFGGITSVVNTEVLSTIDFLPGGFGVRYGGATAGVVDLTTRPGRDDHRAGIVDANVYDAQAVGQGPIGHDASKGRVIGAIRRSYIDAILRATVPSDALAFSVAPRYYDYQLRYDAPAFGSGGNAHVLLYGSDDALGFVARAPTGTAGATRGSFSFETRFHRLQIPWSQPMGKGWQMTLTPSLGYQDVGVNAGDILAIENIATDVSVRAEATGPLFRDADALVGVEGHLEEDRTNISITGGFGTGTPRVIELHKTYGLARAAIYAQTHLSVGPTVSIIPGVRVDAFAPSSGVSADPRLAIRWDPLADWSAKFYAGVYHQPPTAQQWDRDLGDPELRSPYALQTGAGVRHRFGEAVTIDTELFYKWLGDQVVQRPADAANGQTRRSYTNHQIGRAWGWEVLVKRELGNRLYGWIAYTLSKSERSDPYTPGGWRPFQFDQTHILTVLAGYKLGRGWEIGARGRYTTGNPTTVAIGAVFNADTGNYSAIEGPINGARVPPFQQFDVRLDKRFDAFGAAWDVYLDVQNATNRRNPELERYDFDYSHQVPVTGLPTIPSVGVRGEF